jgi:apolipoprotein N-acyltransferase
MRASSFADSRAPKVPATSRPKANEGWRESSRLAIWAVAVVFGIPFLYCVQGAARGHLFTGPHADASLLRGFAAWAVTGALGSLWLGVSLHLGLASRLPERARDALAFGLIVAGAAALLLSPRLLG